MASLNKEKPYNDLPLLPPKLELETKLYYLKQYQQVGPWLS